MPVDLESGQTKEVFDVGFQEAEREVHKTEEDEIRHEDIECAVIE